MHLLHTVRPAHRRRGPLAATLLATLALASCGSTADDAGTTDTTQPDVTTPDTDTATDTDTEATTDTDAEAATDTDTEAATDTDTEAATDDTGPSGAATTVDIGLFFDGAIVGEVATEPCTLSDGTESECHRITVAGDPVTYDTGPFCPTSIDDDADAGGIWFDDTGVYDIDGDFIVGLAELYDDTNWMMFDDEGNVLVTETAEEFDLAARPNVDPDLQNHCVEGRLEWLPDGEPISSTVLIPTEPVLTDTATSPGRGNLGVTLDGVVIAASAPVDAILGAYTIAAFDDCGGHYNPNDGYHLHGAVGCSELAEASDGETPMFAYALDGFAVHSPLDDPASADLDECNGHDTGDGYHYHANPAEQNLVLVCFMGEVAR